MRDDLPRFETEFKHNLNLNTMREIAQFRSKPHEQRDEIRRRIQTPLLPGVTEMSVRSSEFACVAPDAGTVYVIENEISYLAFPEMADAAAVFGGGFAISGIASTPWLKDRRIVYWGDIDTHGFVALDRLRTVVPHTESMLMDRPTLLAHPDQWVGEAAPTSAPLPNLTQSEAALYRDLVEGTHGEQVRLEQERISFPMVQSAFGIPSIPRSRTDQYETCIYSANGPGSGGRNRCQRRER